MGGANVAKPAGTHAPAGFDSEDGAGRRRTSAGRRRRDDAQALNAGAAGTLRRALERTSSRVTVDCS